MRKLKLGIIGYGNMGTAHVNNIMAGKTPNTELAALCDIDPERRKIFSEKYPEIPVFENAEVLMDSGLCEAILIAVPHYDHVPMAIMGFNKGLHVLVEKPAGVYTKQVREMNEVARKSGKVFGLMLNQRTNPVFGKLREMIARGDLGNIKRITWIITNWYRKQAYHDSSEWRSTWRGEGGGTLINQNPHQLDLWQWVFGMPDKVYARASFGKYRDIEVEDEVVAMMEYDNGMIGQYITSTAEAPGTNRLEIACDMGQLIIENNNKMTFRRNVVPEPEFNKNQEPFGMPEFWNCEIPVDATGGEQHVGIIKNFADAVLSGKELLAKGEEGICGLTISNAMHLSAWTGETVDIKNFPDDKFYDMLQEKIKNSTVVKNVRKVVADTTGTY